MILEQKYPCQYCGYATKKDVCKDGSVCKHRRICPLCEKKSNKYTGKVK